MTIAERLSLFATIVFLGVWAIASTPVQAAGKCEAECNRQGAKCANQSNQDCARKTRACVARCQ